MSNMRCEQCRGAITGDPHLVGEEVVCRSCHDLLQPECPHCGRYIKRKTTPARRSKFKCPHCSKVIHVDPRQYVYSRPYLTSREAVYVDYVYQLDRWIFTLGSQDDYEAVRRELSKRFKSEPQPADVIWALMNRSMTMLGENHKSELKAMARTFGGKVPKDLQGNTSAYWQMQDLKRLMDEFHAFRKTSPL